MGAAMNTLAFHPLADIFPLVEGTEFAELVADIRDHGLHEPIVVFEGQILDGRNRYRACEAAGIEPSFTVYTGDDPVSYVVSLNLRRRHLDESQRAMVAAKLATLKQGARTDLSPIGEMSQGQAAALLNVGKRSVERAAEVRDHGAAELIHAVERGAVSVPAAADIATQSVDEQREIVARGEREILRAAQEIRARKAEIRHAERIAKLVAISNNNAPLAVDRRYAVIYADPPWEREPGTSSPNREIENHYPTMPIEEICALSVADLATPDAVLFLWATSPLLPQALEVMRAWGFEYKTGMVWVKDSFGTGYWVRSRHEFLLIGKRGDMPHPAPAARPDSVIEAPRREHSRKPDEAYELIERMYPELPKIELFARQARPGWAAWGNQVAA
jgi:N6-adenosine-specific RNA methylase IME4/ParB-like chromosome segregation protein Spo0J